MIDCQHPIMMDFIIGFVVVIKCYYQIPMVLLHLFYDASINYKLIIIIIVIIIVKFLVSFVVAN